MLIVAGLVAFQDSPQVAGFQMRARSRSSRRHPPIQRADLPRRYYERELRPVSVGEVGLAVGRVGWILVRGGLNEVRTDEHGTHALPARPGTDHSRRTPNRFPQKEPEQP